MLKQACKFCSHGTLEARVQELCNKVEALAGEKDD
jgi:hypothetical protein